MSWLDFLESEEPEGNLYAVFFVNAVLGDITVEIEHAVTHRMAAEQAIERSYAAANAHSRIHVCLLTDSRAYTVHRSTNLEDTT